MVRPIIIWIICLLAAALPAMSQELDCTVLVNDRQVSGSSQNHLRNLAPEIERYINQNRWTDDPFETHERIRCDIRVILTRHEDPYHYEANVIIAIRRPIYGTTQETTSLILSDNSWNFSYAPNRSLLQDQLQFDELTSFLDFYVYLIIGYDYDTFSPLDGSYYYRQALEVLEMAQTANSTGWGRSVGTQRTRFGLISDLVHPGFEEFREAVYRYHRLGLDRFTSEPEESREEVLQAIELMRENRLRVNRDLLFDTFFDTKYVELVSLFLEAGPGARREAYDLFSTVDPGHTSEYERLR
ncbi:MAG: DUF4835 family protein [Balneolaceae bacterium]